MNVDEIMILIRECVESPYFECELGLFKQLDGAPMGGPLSCIIADLFMEDYEDKVHIEIGDKIFRADWLRYRDDTWMIWEHIEEEFYLFLDKLNAIHFQKNLEK